MAFKDRQFNQEHHKYTAKRRHIKNPFALGRQFECTSAHVLSRLLVCLKAESEQKHIHSSTMTTLAFLVLALLAVSPVAAGCEDHYDCRHTKGPLIRKRNADQEAVPVEEKPVVAPKESIVWTHVTPHPVQKPQEAPSQQSQTPELRSDYGISAPKQAPVKKTVTVTVTQYRPSLCPYAAQFGNQLPFYNPHGAQFGQQIPFHHPYAQFQWFPQQNGFVGVGNPQIQAPQQAPPQVFNPYG
uniref:Uncharacterized protein n=1 Tax=Steinernema glaseri TaxID=37863 RepID=A0A1I7XZH4_9BILA